jgi:hypothetical protein
MNTHITELHSLLHDFADRWAERKENPEMQSIYFSLLVNKPPLLSTPMTQSAHSHTTLALTWTSTPESKLWQMVSCWRALVSVSCIGKWNKTNSLCSRRMFYWSWRSWSWSIQAHESCILQRAGLTQKHQVQNGLLLCANCHDELLKQYVDVVDDKLVVNDEKSTKIYLS